MERTSFSTFLRSREADGEMVPLLSAIADACIGIGREVRRGAINGTMGTMGRQNVQGETQKKLDVIANTLFLQAMEKTGLVAGMVSEELDAACLPEAPGGKYLVLFDPLDGSSNVDLDMTVGTIFGILPHPRGGRPETADFLQPGSAQRCAGYALYGSSTMLVVSLGQGVHGFTLDEDAGEFLLTHPDMRIPEETAEFAINMANQRHWQPPVQRYVQECLQGKTGPRGKDFNMRWVGAMCAEVHRILLRGGIFMYPLDSKNRASGGRLRQLYEANPMGFIVEQAGGAATTGTARVLDAAPASIHQRIPVVLGSRSEVDRVSAYYRESGPQ